MDTEAAARPDPEAPIPLRDEEGNLRPDFTERVLQAIEGRDAETLAGLVGDLHESDLGDVLQALPPDERGEVVRLLGERFDWLALTEVDEGVRNAILKSVPNEQISELVRDLEFDDAIEIVANLEEEDREQVLASLPFAERIALERSLDYPEDSAGRRMTNKFIAVPPFWTVGQTIDFMREDRRLPDQFTEIYVVDPRFCFIGTVPLDRLLRAKRPTIIGDITGEAAHSVHVTDDQEDVARLFERYNLLSVGVLDDSGRLAGVITIDDIVDVIEEEADEDIKRLAGVGDEEISDTFIASVRSRFVWLVLNLGTAFTAAAVIGLFDATIEQMVALAVLMPIVASLGGNAATQAMTVTVRGLATRDFHVMQPFRLIRRETLVGLTNGVMFAIIVGLIAAFAFGDTDLGLVIGAAMVVNMFAAGLAGVLIPMALDRAGADPAVASSVFVTAITDVLGFFAFLGLAAWWFGLW